MDPIKPIEGTVSNAQEQAIALTEVMRERYWQQQARKTTKVVKAPDTAVEVATRQKKQPDKSAETAKNVLPNTYAEFSVDRNTHRVVVRIIDGNSGELIRTIPPEKLAKEIASGKLQRNRVRRRDIRL